MAQQLFFNGVELSGKELFSENFEQLFEVQQREYAITHKEDSKPVLGTPPIQQCIRLVGYNEEAGITFMGHYDTRESVRSLTELVSLLDSKSTSGMFRVTVEGGGNSESLFIRGSILGYLKTQNKIGMAISLIDTQGIGQPGVAIDSRTGEEFFYCPHMNPMSKFCNSNDFIRSLNLLYLKRMKPAKLSYLSDCI
ncbi:MAG: hypothetical protein HGA85_03530 [Nanoarchaeota archaeon]|nr:hypothetical protein [Nanoarchaeota archaeon]